MQIRSGSALLGLVLFLFAMNTEDSFALVVRSQLDRLAQPMLNEGVAVGFVIGIVKDGKAQVFAYGETSKGSGKAPNSNTVYEIGSASMFVPDKQGNVNELILHQNGRDMRAARQN